MTQTDRALSTGLLEFFAILIVGGVLFIALNLGVIDVHTIMTTQTTDADAQSFIDLLVNSIWGLILFFIVFLAGIFLIARATFESGRGF